MCRGKRVRLGKGMVRNAECRVNRMSAGIRGSIWWPGVTMSETREGEPAEPINYGPSSPTLH